MLNLNTSNWLNILVYLASFAFAWGSVSQRIKALGDSIARLEAKQDKHNGLIERMVKVETRLDGIEQHTS